MAIVIGTGSFLLFMAVATNIVALLVPYWVDDKNWLVNADTYGLWGGCTCNWYYHDFDDVSSSKLEDWFQAVQWLYAAAVAFMGISLLTIFVVSCCSEKSYGRALTAVGSLMLVAAVLIGVALVLFGVKGKDDRGIGLNSTPKLIWGFWIGVGGFGLALVTAIVLLIQGSRF